MPPEELFWCCDPVRVLADFPDDKIPKDTDGKRIWKDRGEIITPASEVERIRLKTFDCGLLDPQTGRCKNYNSPDICRSTSCINSDSKKSVDEQHRETTEEEFFVLKRKKKIDL